MPTAATQRKTANIPQTGLDARLAIRNGEWDGPTSGMAPGYVQGNLAILPAAFVVTFPQLGALNVMRLASPESAVLSAVIFNALIIVALIPLALAGVQYRAVGAAAVLQRNVLLYGIGGLLAPFVGIKIIDVALVTLRLA